MCDAPMIVSVIVNAINQLRVKEGYYNAAIYAYKIQTKIQETSVTKCKNANKTNRNDKNKIRNHWNINRRMILWIVSRTKIFWIALSVGMPKIKSHPYITIWHTKKERPNENKLSYVETHSQTRMKWIFFFFRPFKSFFPMWISSRT